jgi:excisionase family DNA binding protein
MDEHDREVVKLDYRDPEWVAEQLGIDKNTVYKYLQEGSLPGLQLGRKWLVSERRLAEFLERVERTQTERRRQSTSGGSTSRPFALPQRTRILNETEQVRQLLAMLEQAQAEASRMLNQVAGDDSPAP